MISVGVVVTGFAPPLGDAALTRGAQQRWKIAVLSACAFVAFDGKCTETVMEILSAIERSFVGS